MNRPSSTPLLPLVISLGCASGASLDTSTGATDGGTGSATSASASGGTLGTTSATSSSGSTTGGPGSTSGSTSGGTGGSTGGSTGGGDCGNGVVEAGEACDTGDLGGESCETQGFASGGLGCTATCTLDTSGCSMCGNGLVDGTEDCDGNSLGTSETCADVGLGAANEALTCTAQCTYDFGNCSGCGDGMITMPEECEPPATDSDPPDLGGATCASLGFDGGTLECAAGCSFEVLNCYDCGDNVKNGLEQCDAADFGGVDCTDFQAGNGQAFSGGSLSCDASCEVLTTNCKLCGDGEITADEVCDGVALGGETCQTRGYDAGTLACAAGCLAFDESGCSTCGDNVAEGAEQCDGLDLGGNTCQTIGYPGGGTLSCDTCAFDASGCAGFLCGNGVVDLGDLCDCGNQGVNCTSGQLDGKTCADFTSPAGGPFTGGTLACYSPSNCAFDTSGCTYCGDGAINGGESCDGAALGGATCESLGQPAGTLACAANCTPDTSGCTGISVVSGTLNTAVFSANLNDPYITTGRVYILVPTDLVSLSLKVAPNNGTDRLNLSLKDGAVVLASCSVMVDGGLCDLGNAVNLTGHTNKALTLEVGSNSGGFAGPLTITVSGLTGGIANPDSIAVTSSWRGSNAADYVIWPVGLYSGTSFQYGWSETATGTLETYEVGVYPPGGPKYEAPVSNQISPVPWPKGSQPNGWYLWGTSTFFAGGKTWTLTVDP